MCTASPASSTRPRRQPLADRRWERKYASQVGSDTVTGRGRPLVGQPLDFLQSGSLPTPVPGKGQRQPPPVTAHREQDRRQPVGPEERVYRVLAEIPVQQDVGQQPVLRVGVPVEGQPELAPHPAVRAVTADHVASGDRLDLALRPAHARGDGIAAGGQAGELAFPAPPGRPAQ